MNIDSCWESLSNIEAMLHDLLTDIVNESEGVRNGTKLSNVLDACYHSVDNIRCEVWDLMGELNEASGGALEPEADLDYAYYWYDHCELRNNGDAKKVEMAIENKDFDAFLKLKKKYSGRKWEYFPDVIHIWDNKANDFVGELDVNVRENFEKITHSEYECG